MGKIACVDIEIIKHYYRNSVRNESKLCDKTFRSSLRVCRQLLKRGEVVM